VSVAACAHAQPAPGKDDPGAKPVVLVLGDSHMVHKKYLIDWLHESLARQGAIVYSFGACGATPSNFMRPYKTECGRASRTPEGEQQVEEGPVSVWNARELIAKYNPSRIVIVMGDTMGAYRRSDFPKAWIWDEVTSLTALVKESKVACSWVGPPWGRPGGAYGKTDERVRELSDFLAKTVAPCRYLDSTTFARPGEWKSFDGQHLTSAGYKAWAAAIADSIASAPTATAAPPPETGSDAWSQ
jgi:hypothetical protein